MVSTGKPALLSHCKMPSLLRNPIALNLGEPGDEIFLGKLGRGTERCSLARAAIEPSEAASKGVGSLMENTRDC